MKVFGKKVLFTCFSVFLAYRCVELVSYLNTPNRDFTFVQSLVLAFLLTLFVTGVFAFLGFVFPTYRIIPKSYYRIKSPVFVSRLYRVFGVSLFRRLLMIAFWGKRKNRKRYFDGKRAGIENLIVQTKKSEFGHLAALVSIFFLSIPLVFERQWSIFVLVSAINTIGNFYPIILQRHHRMRISKLLRR